MMFGLRVALICYERLYMLDGNVSSIINNVAMYSICMSTSNTNIGVPFEAVLCNLF